MAKDPADWIDNLMEEIRRHVESRHFVFTKHAADQGRARNLMYSHVIHILLNGWHEKDKTLFNTAHQTWNYAIRGKTIDGTEARIIVTFEGGMIIITVIRLTNIAKRKK